MKIKVDFLTHYFGGTTAHGVEKVRIAWATTEVNATVFHSAELRKLYTDTYLKMDVCTIGGRHYVRAEQTNRSYTFMDGDWDYSKRKEKNGTVNFGVDHQRIFAWKAFGFKFFERPVASQFYALTMENIKSYRPSGKILFDETKNIEPKVRAYLEENLAVVDGVVYCRVDYPYCLHMRRCGRHGQVSTLHSEVTAIYLTGWKGTSAKNYIAWRWTEMGSSECPRMTGLRVCHRTEKPICASETCGHSFSEYSIQGHG